MGKFKDLTGLRFGRLTVVRMDKERKNTHIVWECKCDCGNTCHVLGYAMHYGNTKSCGCLEQENRLTFSQFNTKHNYSNDPVLCHVYHVWKSIKGRCRRKTDKRYHRYGGRGISICSEWEDPVNFVNWAIANGYRRGLTLDRIDNDGNYCPENCRFISIRENNRNSSNTHLTMSDIASIRAEYKTGNFKQVDIACKYGITQQTVSKIINYRSWKN